MYVVRRKVIVSLPVSLFTGGGGQVQLPGGGGSGPLDGGGGVQGQRSIQLGGSGQRSIQLGGGGPRSKVNPAIKIRYQYCPDNIPALRHQRKSSYPEL